MTTVGTTESNIEVAPQILLDICGCLSKAGVRYFFICAYLLILALYPAQANAEVALSEKPASVQTTNEQVLPNETGELNASPASGKAFIKSLAHYTQGLVYDSEARIEDAVKEYSSSIEYDNTQPNVYLRLGIDYIILGEYSKALDPLKFAKKFNSEDTKPRVLLALVYANLKKIDLAQKEYEEIIKAKPEDIRSLSSLADLYVIGQKLKEAAAIYEGLLKKNKGKKDEGMLHFNLGIIYAKMERIDDAILQLREAARLEPDYLEAHLVLGVLYDFKNKKEEAIKSYGEILKKDPKNKEARRFLGDIYIDQKKSKEAIQQFEAILKIDTKDPQAYIDLASAYLRLDMAPKAKAVMEDAKKNGIKNYKIYLVEGLIYVQDNQFKEAIEVYKKALEIEPKSSMCNFYIGAAYERSGQKSEAVSFLRKAIEFDKKNSQALNYLGYVYADDDMNLDEAVELIKKALEIEPKNGAFIDSLGWAYFKKGWLGQATNELKKASEIEPQDPTIHDHLGDAYFRSGFRDKAAAEWKKSLELDPKQDKVKEKIENEKAPQKQ